MATLKGESMKKKVVEKSVEMGDCFKGHQFQQVVESRPNASLRKVGSRLFCVKCGHTIEIGE